ncbi:hypothetical protein [Clostridium botulinum]|nr:hypothetical protein [Clostridium botulinum]
MLLRSEVYNIRLSTLYKLDNSLDAYPNNVIVLNVLIKITTTI